ncbi:MAG: phosphoribosylformylglycinamidine synthase subunit PurQ [Pseudomonadota bacterium]
MRVAVVTFPGSNCDRDLAVAFARATGRIPKKVWHAETDLPAVDVVGLPGGFSYGDYLRCGAIAARSPIMAAVADFATRGGRVLGICNGFQILCEAGLLPGALVGNRDRRFVSRWVDLAVTQPSSDFTGAFGEHRRIRVPVAHHDGNYTADPETLARLEGEGQIAFRYVDNPNGSALDIAGILNERGNVLGLMPHPERAIDKALGGTDGALLFRSLVEALA